MKKETNFRRKSKWIIYAVFVPSNNHDTDFSKKKKKEDRIWWMGLRMLIHGRLLLSMNMSRQCRCTLLYLFSTQLWGFFNSLMHYWVGLGWALLFWSFRVMVVWGYAEVAWIKKEHVKSGWGFEGYCNLYLRRKYFKFSVFSHYLFEKLINF